MLWDPRLDVSRAHWASPQLSRALSIAADGGWYSGIALCIRSRLSHKLKLHDPIDYSRRQLS